MTALIRNTEPATGSRHQFLHLTVHQFRADLRCFLRNKGSVFWTLALPILFLVIFGSVFAHQDVAVPGGRIDEPAYYVPGIVAYGLIAATFSNLVVSVVRCREAGIYKRLRATPLSSSAIIAARALVAAVSALAITAILVAIGWAAFGAHISGRTIPAFLLAIIGGAAVFCCLGFAVASLIRNLDAAQPVVLAIVLPLCFLSGVFIPILELPGWLVDVGKIFPVHALADALLAAYNPHTVGIGINWVDLAILGAWGAGALMVATRRFGWLPRSR
jgi:ABC-2 type transport system permease protein